MGNERLVTSVSTCLVRVAYTSDIETWLSKNEWILQLQRTYGTHFTKNQYGRNMRLILLTEEGIYMLFLQDHYMF